MLRAALFGSAVTLGLIVVPVVHFVTAIPSPFIGGYLAGTKAAPEPGRGLLLGLIMAAILVAPLAGALFVLSWLWLDLALGQYGIASAVLFGFVAGLAGLGAVLGGVHARRTRA